MKTISFTLLIAVCLTTINCFAQRKWVNITEIGAQLGRIQANSNPDYSNLWVSSSSFAPSYGRYPSLPPNYGVNRNSLSIQTFNGVRLKNSLTPGITLGADWYGNSQFFPVMAALRGDILKKQRRISPYYSVDAGYGFRGFGYSSDLRGGLAWSAGGGLRINTGNKTGLAIGVAYKQQNAVYNTPVDGIYTISQRENRVYNRLALRLGICF